MLDIAKDTHRLLGELFAYRGLDPEHPNPFLPIEPECWGLASWRATWERSTSAKWLRAGPAG